MNAPVYPIVRRSVVGRFFVDESCIYCDLCVEIAPENFACDADAGVAYLFKQPSTPEELAQVIESLEGCPTESIGDQKNDHPNLMPRLPSTLPVGSGSGEIPGIMKEDPKFTMAWRALIVVAIVLSLMAHSALNRQKEADEKRMDAMEESIKRIETFLYEKVAPSIQSR